MERGRRSKCFPGGYVVNGHHTPYGEFCPELAIRLARHSVQQLLEEQGVNPERARAIALEAVHLNPAVEVA